MFFIGPGLGCAGAFPPGVCWITDSCSRAVADMITDPRLSVIFPRRRGPCRVLSVAGRIDGLAAGKARVRSATARCWSIRKASPLRPRTRCLRHTVDLEARAKLVAFDVVKLAEIDAALPDGGQGPGVPARRPSRHGRYQWNHGDAGVTIMLFPESWDAER